MKNALLSANQKEPPRGVMFWKYAANLQENTHAEVWWVKFGMSVLL